MLVLTSRLKSLQYDVIFLNHLTPIGCICFELGIEFFGAARFFGLSVADEHFSETIRLDRVDGSLGIFLNESLRSTLGGVQGRPVAGL